MDEEGFISFMKKKRKTPSTIDVCVENAKDFEVYLEQQGKSINNVTVEDLESFIVDYVDKKRVSKYICGHSVTTSNSLRTRHYQRLRIESGLDESRSRGNPSSSKTSEE